MKTCSNRSPGFTLIELLVTIALLAIIASLAAPAIGTFVSRSAMRGISADFTLGLQRARSEAINRNQCVVMCMSSDGANCASSGTNWGVGWIAFNSPTCKIVTPVVTPDADPNTNQAVLFLTHQSINSRYILNNDDEVHSVIFSPRGNTRTSTNTSFDLEDTGVPVGDAINRTFCLDRAGRVRTVNWGPCP